MRGFIIKSSTWGDEVCRVGMEGEYSLGVDFSVSRLGEAYWGVGGFKMPEECHWIWKGGPLRAGIALVRKWFGGFLRSMTS